MSNQATESNEIEFNIGMMVNGGRTFPDSQFHVDVINKGFSNKLDTNYIPLHRNLHNETRDMMKILDVQNSKSRRQRRATR